MKYAVFAVALLSFAVLVGAQTPPQRQEARLLADSVTVVGNVVQLRGNVEIRRGGLLVSADEADVIGNESVTAAPGGIELRGNVRLTNEEGAEIPLPIQRRR